MVPPDPEIDLALDDPEPVEHPHGENYDEAPDLGEDKADFDAEEENPKAVSY